MRQKGFAPVMIFAIVILSIVGYFGYQNIFKQKDFSPPSASEKNAVDLVGIWQANGSMAAGWSDRYHFYGNGKFHFYPNQMTNSSVEEEIGTWKIEDNLLILNNKTYTLKILGMEDGDFYPSIMIGNSQYWKFSSDPTSYGSEKFPNE